MFIGHAAVGFAAKRIAPRTSLGMLLLAPYFCDLLWPILLLFGWEKVRIDPGNTVVTPLAFDAYPISHSLVLVVVWALVIGGAYAAITRYARGAFWIGALVVSHWFLDAIVHRPDLPLRPGGSTRVGLGLWNSEPATIVLEGLLFAWGLSVYLRSTRPRGFMGVISLWSMVAILLLAYVQNLLGPPPPSAHAVALVGLAGWLFVPWAYWVEYTRMNARFVL